MSDDCPTCGQDVRADEAREDLRVALTVGSLNVAAAARKRLKAVGQDDSQPATA